MGMNSLFFQLFWCKLRKNFDVFWPIPIYSDITRTKILGIMRCEVRISVGRLLGSTIVGIHNPYQNSQDSNCLHEPMPSTGCSLYAMFLVRGPYIGPVRFPMLVKYKDTTGIFNVVDYILHGFTIIYVPFIYQFIYHLYTLLFFFVISWFFCQHSQFHRPPESWAQDFAQGCSEGRRLPFRGSNLFLPLLVKKEYEPSISFNRSHV